MARLTIDDRQIEAPDGAPLVEVIKNAGIYISNLCYVDGLSAYSGCRTCLVEIEGARGLQLSCTTKVADGMVVRTDTNEVKERTIEVGEKSLESVRREVTSAYINNFTDIRFSQHHSEKK